MSTTLSFSKSEVDRFRHTNKHLRYGQQFHQKFKLDKVKDPKDKIWCDKLYHSADEHAKQMIAARIDHSQ